LKNILKNNQLNRIYLTEVFRSISHSSLGLFLPIFLVSIGTTPTELSLFFITLFSVVYISGIIGIIFFHKKANLVIIASMFFRGFFYYLLFIYASWQPLAIIFGIAIGLYWYIIDLSLIYIPKNKKGLRIGIFYGLMSLASIIGPILGGFVIASFGYNSLFLFVIILLIPTIISAYFIGKFKWEFKPIKLQAIKNLLKKKHIKIILFFVPIYGIIFMQSIFYYPLLLHQYVGTELGMGIIQTVINVLVAVSYLLAGKIFDLQKGKFILILSMMIIGVSLIGISVSPTIETFTVSSWISNFGFALIASPFWAMIGASVNKEDLASLVILTNLFLVSGRVIAVIFLNPLLVANNFGLIYLILGSLAFVGMICAFFIPSELFNKQKIEK